MKIVEVSYYKTVREVVKSLDHFPHLVETNKGFSIVRDPPRQHIDRKMRNCKIAQPGTTVPYDFLNEELTVPYWMILRCKTQNQTRQPVSVSIQWNPVERDRERESEKPEPLGKGEKDRNRIDRQMDGQIDREREIERYRETSREGEPELQPEGQRGDRDRICIDRQMDIYIYRQIDR